MCPVPLTVYKDGRMKNESKQHVRIRWGTLWWILVCQRIFSLFSGVDSELLRQKDGGGEGRMEKRGMRGLKRKPQLWRNKCLCVVPPSGSQDWETSFKQQEPRSCSSERSADTLQHLQVLKSLQTHEKHVNTVNSISFSHDEELKQKGIKIYQIHLYYIKVKHVFKTKLKWYWGKD